MREKSGGFTSTGREGCAGKFGFTLLELLTVIAILLMTAALLLPALRGGREKGRRTVCLGNLRQVSFSMLMAADDSGGLIPSFILDTEQSFGYSSWSSPSTASTAATASTAVGFGRGQANTVLICHRPPGNPGNTQNVELPIWTLDDHLAHGDYIGPCTIIALGTGQDFSSVFGPWWTFDAATCPSDRKPDEILVRDTEGDLQSVPCSYNINLEFPRTRARVDLLRMPDTKVLVFDGHPSQIAGAYHISNFTALYAAFRHEDHLNTIFADGHGELRSQVNYAEIRLED